MKQQYENKGDFWEMLGIALLILSIGGCVRLIDDKPLIVIEQNK